MPLAQIWTNIIAYCLQIGLLVAVGAGLPTLLRFGGTGRAPAARLLYWQTLLVACVALPWVRPWQTELIVVSRAPVTILFAGSQSQSGVAATPVMPSFAVIALWIIGAGIVLRLIWLAAGMRKLARYRRNGHPLPLPSEWTGMASETTLLISEDVTGPVTFGLRKPVVLLPSGFSSMPSAMRDAILFHELLHVERRDWLFTLGEEILRAVFWFHPAIWWVLGEVQLAREQTVDRAVVEMTQARDPYVDTLLAMAGVSAEMDLASAPSFLRRRHLKQRVLGIVQERKMSKTRLVIAQVAALAMMAAAVWFITAAVPMHAQAQTATDDVGVTVNLNGVPIMHRSPIGYPATARATGIEGTVVVQVHLDANGEVTDDAILSGPEELRRGVQQSVLSWHFDKSVGSSTQVVNVSFAKAPGSTAPVVVSPAQPVSVPNPALQRFQQTEMTALRQRVATLQQQQASPQQIQEAESLLTDLARRIQQNAANSSGKIDSIEVIGLSDTAKAQLLAQLPVHVGDTYSLDLASQVMAAAHEFDKHLQVGSAVTASGGRILTIRIPQLTAFASSVVPNVTTTIGAQRIGGAAMSAKLIGPATTPVYPPLAKMARQQGTVKFDATIGQDGKMADLKVISGPPLLIQAAQDAVETWTYQPTLLNGEPVSVQTTIDVNFSLTGGDSN